MKEVNELADIMRNPLLAQKAERPVFPPVKPCNTLDELSDKERIERSEQLIEEAAYAIADLRGRVEDLAEMLNKRTQGSNDDLIDIERDNE